MASVDTKQDQVLIKALYQMGPFHIVLDEVGLDQMGLDKVGPKPL